MRAQVQKWGNSLAVRIPKAYAVDLGLAHDTAVELALEDGCLVVRPSRQVRYNLRELLDGVTMENLHFEQDFGQGVGGEEW
jgi:antitoxin MazE